MKTGKASEAVLDRSVLRPLHKVQAAGAQAAFGEDCAFWQNQCCASVSGTVGGTFDRTPEMMLENAVCGLAVSGARAEYAMISVVFPAEWDEKELKRLMNGLSQAAGRLEISIAGGHTEISDAVIRPVLTLTVFSPLSHALTPRMTPAKSITSAPSVGSRLTPTGASRFAPKRWKHLQCRQRTTLRCARSL